MALTASKTLRFVRAPDENVFIAPFNLLELVFLIIPLEWWLPTARYRKLNDVVMGVLYSPLLVITSFFEVRQARAVGENRKRGEQDDDTTEEWEELGYSVEEQDADWADKVKKTAPNVEIDLTTSEVRRLQSEVVELKELLMKFISQRDQKQ